MLRTIAVLLALAGWVVAADESAGDDLQAAVKTYFRDRPAPELAEYRTETFVEAPAGGGVAGWLNFRLYAWYPALEGGANTEAGGIGIDVDLSTDLGLGGENELTGMFELFLTLGGIGLRFDGYFVEFESATTLTRTITFGGFTFQIDEDVDARVEIGNLRLFLAIPLVKMDSFRLDLLGGVSAFFIEGRVRAAGGEGSVAGTIPIPVIGAQAQIEIGRFLLFGDVSGLTIDVGGIDGTTLDVQAGVGITVFKILAVRVGYRYVLIEGEVNGVEFDSTLDGFFIGGSVQF